MKKYIMSLLVFGAFASSLFAGTVELIEPEGLGEVIAWRWDSVECVNDSCSIRVIPIATNSATSNVFQPFTFRITSTDGVNWSTLYFMATTCGGDFSYPESVRSIPWWVGWITPSGGMDWNALFQATRLSYSWFIDTLSDTCWLVHIVPGAKIQPISFVYDSAETIFWGDYTYCGPLWQVTGDTLSPGFGQFYYVDSFSPNRVVLLVEDTLGGPAFWCGVGLGIDYNGPVASQPYPPDSSTTMDTIPEIQVVILDTFTYDFYPYPDSSGGTILPTEPHCACYEPGCTTSTGEWLHYPYCAAIQIHRARIDTTSIRLSVNGIEYTLESPGMHWLHDSLLVLNTEEAGLTFERGETVRVCLEEATDRTSLGYGPNHLGRRWDWTHPDTPIPFCWEFYIAGTGIEEAAATPEGFGIKSIKPNPFNSRAEIKFELAKEAEVSITVYNVQGQKVESLMKEKALASGSHSVVWNANDRTPTGIYFIKLFAGAFEDVKKVILLK